MNTFKSGNQLHTKNAHSALVGAFSLCEFYSSSLPVVTHEKRSNQPDLGVFYFSRLLNSKGHSCCISASACPHLLGQKQFAPSDEALAFFSSVSCSLGFGSR